jgi:hypothetical protein
MTASYHDRPPRKPRGHWAHRANRAKATRDLVRKLGKDITRVTRSDFISNGLRFISPYCRGSPYLALRDAGYDLEPCDMKRRPRGYWSRERRVLEVRRLVARLGKSPDDITSGDFIRNGLDRVMRIHGKSPYKALKEAGYEPDEYRMTRVPSGYWRSRENRVSEMKWLLERAGKPPELLTVSDFCRNGLGGLFKCYSTRTHAASNGMPWSKGKNAIQRMLADTGIRF